MKTSRTIMGVDVAKHVFQVYWVDVDTGEEMNICLARAKFLSHFANRAPCLIAVEACGGSQHWARHLQKLGHEIRILPAKMVRPLVRGNKNDAHDARAIWAAVQQPGVRAVAVKTEEQQAVLALHRMRQQLVKFRTAQINGLRDLLTEYGEGHCQVNLNPLLFDAKSIRANTTNQRLGWHVDQCNLQEIS